MSPHSRSLQKSRNSRGPGRWYRVMICLFAALATLLVLSPLAMAQGQSASNREDARADVRGTHFIVEGTFGMSVPLADDADGVGLSTGALFGFGGKIPDTPLRLYAVLGFEFVDFSIIRDGRSEDRSLNELAVGGRALVPLIPHLRAFVDGMFGATWLRRSVTGKDGSSRELVDETPRFGVLVGGGLQFRPLIWLSAGVQVRCRGKSRCARQRHVPLLNPRQASIESG